MGFDALVAGLAVVVEARSLGEGFATVQASVGFVTSVHSRVGLQCRRLPKGFTAYFTAIGPLAIVRSGVAEHGSLVPKCLMAHGALKRLFTGMLTEVVVQVDPGLERFVARRTGEVADVFVMASDVSSQPAGFAKRLAAVLAPNLPSDAVRSEMVAERIAIGILFGTDVALRLLAFVRGLVNAGRRAIVESERAPVTEKSAFALACRAFATVFEGVLLHFAFVVFVIGFNGIPGNVQPQVTS